MNSNVIKRKSKLGRNLTILISAAVGFAVITVLLIKMFQGTFQDRVTNKKIVDAWNQYDYQKVNELTAVLLEENPFNNFALVYHGFSSFYVALSQLDTLSTQNYLDDAINSLRIALYSSKSKLRGQIAYVLGKAYFYKNTITSYYYSDLAIKYLEEAKNSGYKPDDLYEYLGLSYAALDMTMESIAAFTEALIVRESYSLLLSIGEQYYKAGQENVAKQYLYRIVNDCEDDNLVNKSLNLLGLIYIDEKDYGKARESFDNILKKNQNSADAFYGIGVIYEKQGDLVKARSEWRKALKIHVNHPGALAKMAAYN
ncbi:MAG: tetratricopeptide repeat protein [Treponema sp.]|nr:tetratricopeptide repeat protein [Treponema sp.]